MHPLLSHAFTLSMGFSVSEKVLWTCLFFNQWEGLNFKCEVPWLVSQASTKNRNSFLATRVICTEYYYLHYHRKSESNGHATLNKYFGTTMKVVHFEGQLWLSDTWLGWDEECVGSLQAVSIVIDLDEFGGRAKEWINRWRQVTCALVIQGLFAGLQHFSASCILSCRGGTYHW